MSILALVTEVKQVNTVVSWASRFAIARDAKLIVLCWSHKNIAESLAPGEIEGDPHLEQIVEEVDRVTRANAETTHDDWPQLAMENIQVLRLDQLNVTEGVLAQVRKDNAQLLVAPASGPVAKGTSLRGIYSSDNLQRQSPCNTIVLYGDGGGTCKADNIFAALTDGPHDRIAVSLVSRLSESSAAQTTIGTLEENTGEEAMEVGYRELRQVMRDAGIKETDQLQLQVFLADRGYEEIVDTLATQDLVVIGINKRESIKRILPVMKNTVFGVIKRAPPLRHIGRHDAKIEWIPRLHPADFVDMIQGLRMGSRFSADFMIMLGLAAAIASLGLLQDSAAVVIGSMILAPLMTPMVGSGLALAQANPRLARLCFKTIFFGFLLTLGISYILGLTTPGEEITPQVLARGNPNLLDLMIALFSGAAAAYALARPNLIGAVAGVAIAVALVPPLCSAGIGLSYGQYLIALGAGTLFASNFVAIVLAAAFTFRLLGVTASAAAPRQRRWVYEVVGALGLAAILLAIPLEIALNRRVEQGLPQPRTYPVARSVIEKVTAYVEKNPQFIRDNPDVELLSIGRHAMSENSGDVFICLLSPKPLNRSIQEKLRKIVRDEMADDSLHVEIYCVQEAWVEGEIKKSPAMPENP